MLLLCGPGQVGKLEPQDAIGFDQEQWGGVKKAGRAVWDVGKKVVKNVKKKIVSIAGSIIANTLNQDKTPYTMNGPDGTVVGLGGNVFVLPSFALKGTYQKYPIYPRAVVWGSGLQYDTSSGKLQDATGMQVGYVSKVSTSCVQCGLPT